MLRAQGMLEKWAQVVDGEIVAGSRATSLEKLRS